MENSNKSVNVAVGVIKQDEQYFVCRRQAHQHQGDKWEFPGGKVDINETVVNALKRELKEEIGIDVQQAQHLLDINFDYPDKTVNLHVYLVTDFKGQAHGAEGQQSQWVTKDVLFTLDFPSANQAILAHLSTLG